MLGQKAMNKNQVSNFKFQIPREEGTIGITWNFKFGSWEFGLPSQLNIYLHM